MGELCQYRPLFASNIRNGKSSNSIPNSSQKQICALPCFRTSDASDAIVCATTYIPKSGHLAVGGLATALSHLRHADSHKGVLPLPSSTRILRDRRDDESVRVEWV